VRRTQRPRGGADEAMERQPRGDAPPLRGYVVRLMLKVEGRWRVLESHPNLYPPSPSR
jgi:hypothetical protein